MTPPKRYAFFAPRGLLLRAALLLVAYLVLHILGGRAATAFLSGTPVGGYAHTCLGIAYALAHFAAVIVAPILALAALFIHLATRFFTSRARQEPASK